MVRFDWLPEQAALRERVRDVLRRELPPDWAQLSRHGPGSKEQTRFSLSFCPKLAREGLLIPHWPVEHGGRGAAPWEHFIIGEELWAAGEPRGAQYMNVNFIGMTIIRYGTAEQKARYLPDMAAGRVIWCQGFSEPDAGSDLAALQTRARVSGDEYVINGAKVWTSYAALAKYCFLLARTGGPGKAGIAIFLVPMDSPGITVRPISALVGEGDLHEVFFDDVRVPGDCRLGQEGEAWPIITYALANERVGIARYAFARRVLDGMVAELKQGGRFQGAVVKARAGRALAACEAARMQVYRIVHERASNLPPSAESSLARVAVVNAEHAVADFGLDFLPETYTGRDFPMHLSHHERAIASGIASGAAEVQLNLIARNYLRLPSGVRQ